MIRHSAARLSLALALALPALPACQRQSMAAAPVDAAPDAIEPASNLNLNLTEVLLSRDTVPAGETVEVRVLTKNASGAKTSFKNVRLQLGLRGGSSLGTFGGIQAREGGVYAIEFTARRAGTPAEVEIRINGEVPHGSAPKLTVVPGPVSLAQSLVTVSPPSVRAGTGAKVVFKALDQLGNQLATGGLNVAFSINGGTSSGDFGPVTDHQDGTYSAEFTGLAAGGPSPVLAKVGGGGVTSPLPAVTVTAGAFSPLMTQITASDAAVRSGENAEITIVAKDAYGNRINEGGQSFQLQLLDGTSTGAFGPVRDLQNGTYSAAFTGWAAGTPARITATSGGQTVGTSAPIAVTGGEHDPSKSSLACAASKITLGGSLVCTLTVKDRHGNPSAAGAAPEFALEGGSSEGEFAAAQSPAPGVYTSVFNATKAGSPAKVAATIDGSQAAAAAPTIEILFPSLTESSISLDADEVSSGKNTTARFQARDASGQPIPAEGLRVEFTPLGAGAAPAEGDGSSSVEIGAVQDRGGGLYVATVTGQRAGAPAKITAKINDQAFDGDKPSLTVTAGALTRIQIESAPDGTGRSVGAQDIQDGASFKVHLIGRDAAGNFVSNIKASGWSLSDQRFGSLSERSGPATELLVSRSVASEDGVRIKATYAGPPALIAESGPLQVKGPPPSAPELVR